MKLLYKGIAIIIGVLTSCDAPHSILVDNSKKREFQADCGCIVVTGSSGLSDWIIINFDGTFWVQPDSMRYFRHSESTLSFSLNDSLIDNHQSFLVNGKKQLRITVRAKLPLNWARKDTIKLLPSNFILCDGKPVITDTIRFNCRSLR